MRFLQENWATEEGMKPGLLIAAFRAGCDYVLRWSADWLRAAAPEVTPFAVTCCLVKGND